MDKTKIIEKIFNNVELGLTAKNTYENAKKENKNITMKDV